MDLSNGAPFAKFGPSQRGSVNRLARPLPWPGERAASESLDPDPEEEAVELAAK